MAILNEKTREKITRGGLFAYAIIMLIFMFTPMICIGIISFAPTRFLNFPFPRPATLKWYEEMLQSLAIREAIFNSLAIAAIVTVVSVVFATLGALAFVRYNYKGKKLFQRALLLPIFFPQSVLGLVLLIWFSNWGVTSSWFAAVLGQLVWIVPVVTLIISIQVFGYDSSLETAARDLGAKPIYVFRRITLPILAPGIFSGGLFAFLLSWVNFPISYYTSGVDATVPVWLHTKSVLAPIPSANALGFVIFLISLFLLIPPFIMMSRKVKK